MNQVNFLPDKYRHRRERRRRVTRQIALIVVLFACVLAAWALQQQQTASLAAQAARLESQAESVLNQQLEVNRLDQQRKDLVKRVNLQHRLGMSLPDSRILAELGRNLPAKVGLTDIAITYHQPPNAGNKHRPQTKSHGGYLHIVLKAIAPDDMTVANLVSTLARAPLFSQVTMQFSRPVKRDGVFGRQFGLSMRVDLTRRFVFARAGREANHAD